MSEAQLGENNHNFGQTLPSETKEKMSLVKKGKNHPHYGLKGEKSYNFGKIHSEETRKKMSEAHSGDKNYFFGKTHTE